MKILGLILIALIVGCAHKHSSSSTSSKSTMRLPSSESLSLDSLQEHEVVVGLNFEEVISVCKSIWGKKMSQASITLKAKVLDTQNSEVYEKTVVKTLDFEETQHSIENCQRALDRL